MNTNNDNWKYLESLDSNVNNDELIERVNILTEYVNYLHKMFMGTN